MWWRSVADDYDPLKYETWPEDQKAFAGRVVFGLRDGDIKPLADYIRAGHYLEPTMAHEIADALEGKDSGYYHLVSKGRRPNQQGWTKSIQSSDRMSEIGVWVATALRDAPRGASSGIHLEAQTKFKASRTVVLDALRHVRWQMDYMRKDPTKGDADAWLIRKYEFWFGD